MATTISIDDKFDCTPEVLFDRLSDNDFDDDLMKALNMSKALIESKDTPQGPTYKIRLTNPDTIPAIAKRFTGEHLSYVETRIWNRSKLGNTSERSASISLSSAKKSKKWSSKASTIRSNAMRTIAAVPFNKRILPAPALRGALYDPLLQIHSAIQRPMTTPIIVKTTLATIYPLAIPQ